MTKKLTKQDFIFIIIAFFILFLLVFFLYRIPRLKQIADTYPYLVKVVYLLIMVLAAFAYSLFKKYPKCPICKGRYNDFKLYYDTGMIECIKCGHKVRFDSVYNKDEREFILDNMLESQNITEEEKIKIKKLKSQSKFLR